MEFLPWWGGALALFAVTLSYFLAVGRPLGVSSSWSRVLGSGTEDADAAFAKASAQSPDAVAQALMAATLAQFPELASEPSAPQEPAAPLSAPAKLLPRAAHFVFLGALGLGGLAHAALSPSGYAARTTLGPTFERLFTSGPAQAAVLLLGGVLVGFGTRMSAGCTSGHGLSGISRLQAGSLIATATFFGAGIVTSLALHAVLS